jgi:hypothetical protein
MRQREKYLHDILEQARDWGAGVLCDIDASVHLLERLGQGLRCDWGTVWKVDGIQHHLSPIATWSSPSHDAPALEIDTRGRNLTLSEGNAGHVWRSQKPIWTVDLIKDMCLPRSIDAMDAGLRGGIWFAIKTERATYGIIELLGRDLPPPTAELLAGVEILGIRLGEAVEDATKT